MKFTYPIVLTPDDGGYVVFIPDFNINTEGSTLGEAIEMAMDAIGLMGIDLEDGGRPFPLPSQMESVVQTARDDILTPPTPYEVGFLAATFCNSRRRRFLRISQIAKAGRCITVVRTDIDITAPLTKTQEKMLQDAACRPIAPDDDCPELTDADLALFRRVQKKPAGT